MRRFRPGRGGLAAAGRSSPVSARSTAASSPVVSARSPRNAWTMRSRTGCSSRSAVVTAAAYQPLSVVVTLLRGRTVEDVVHRVWITVGLVLLILFVWFAARTVYRFVS